MPQPCRLLAITLSLPHTLGHPAIQHPEPDYYPTSTLTEHQSPVLTALSPTYICGSHKHNRRFPQTYVQVPCIHHLHLANKPDVTLQTN
ncbi:hypothetical protein DFP73DRAFT_568878 [Morchella snyderi]|nr:hypothetical protein DFP73DRAFT_568878 [Morchella snyderi]